MKTFNRITLFVLLAVLFTACSPSAITLPAPLPTPAPVQGDNPYAPQGGDDAMLRGDIRIDSASLASQPPLEVLNFAYFQPTPCFHLRVEVGAPDSQNRVNVNAYAVTEKDKACTLMALSTPLKASLSLGSYPKGHYSVYVNGTKAGEFDS